MARRYHDGRTSMIALVHRISGIGSATAVFVALALAAIVEQTVVPVPAKPSRAAAQAPVPEAAHPVPSASRSHRPSRTSLLELQVGKTVLAQRGSMARSMYGVSNLARPIVRLSRVDTERGWALGTSAIPPPAGVTTMPEASVFVARRTGARWTIGLAGTKDFLRLLGKSPLSLVPKDQRPSLIRYGNAAAAAKSGGDTGLTLPWDAGQSWSVQTSQTPVEGQEELELNGGDGRVLAPGDGRIFRLCSSTPGRGLVLLIHPNGLASEYYQLTDVPNLADGSFVKRGDYLGHVGTDQPCGPGTAAWPGVRFALRSAARPLSLDGRVLGGWTLHMSSGSMWADHAGVRVDAGNPLLNFGTATGVPSPTVTPSPGGTPEPTPTPST